MVSAANDGEPIIRIKNMKKQLLRFLTLLTLAAWPAVAQENSVASAPPYKAELDITYCTVDGKELKLNAFLRRTRAIPRRPWWKSTAAGGMAGTGRQELRPWARAGFLSCMDWRFFPFSIGWGRKADSRKAYGTAAMPSDISARTQNTSTLIPTGLR